MRWGLLGLLLVANLVVAATLDRRDWPGFLGDEATYLMQAESLAWDFDLRYERTDYDRFVGHWQRPPDGLILQSPDQGRSMTFGKPSFYPLFAAPFVRLSPTRGAGIGNALLLALAALAAAAALQRRLGASAPLWVAAFVFASITFAHTLWAHADLFLACLTALAFSLAYGGAEEPPAQAAIIDGERPPLAGRGRFVLRWALVGLLLAVVAFSRPFYASLLLAAPFALPRHRRLAGAAALSMGAALLLAVAVLPNLALRGSWTSYGGERLAFYSHTGFPLVEMPADEWPQEIARRTGPGSWIRPGALLPYDFEPRVTAYNTLYFLAGRNVGVLPYFLPLLLALLAFRRGEGRWALLAAVLLAVACFFFVRPFNFYGGGGALANRYFLPLYPACWFLAARPIRGLWLPLTAVAGLFLWPLWTHPQRYPLPTADGLGYVSPLAERWLPYETTQSHLKPSGQEDVQHHGLWIKPLSAQVRVEDGGARFRLPAGATGELLIGSPRPLAGLALELAPPGAARLELSGAALAGSRFLPSGGALFELDLQRPTARHRMWWSEDDYWLYRLRFALADSQPRPATLELRPRDPGDQPR